jgi:hypothetical protein
MGLSRGSENCGAKQPPVRSKEQPAEKKGITMLNFNRISVLAMAGLAITISSGLGAPRSRTPEATLVASGLEGALGTTVGPGGDLYVAETSQAQVAKFDPRTGEVSIYATGLPPTIWGYGSPVDVAFIGHTLYALTALESDLFPNPFGLTGIYRMDGPDSFTPIVNIGEWSREHPPESAFEDPPGAPFALQTYRGGFLVTEGHHNRVLEVTLDGAITELIAFDDIVPTGLDLWGNTIFMGEAGPVPHRPEDGKVVAFRPG